MMGVKPAFGKDRAAAFSGGCSSFVDALSILHTVPRLHELRHFCKREPTAALGRRGGKTAWCMNGNWSSGWAGCSRRVAFKWSVFLAVVMCQLLQSSRPLTSAGFICTFRLFRRRLTIAAFLPAEICSTYASLPLYVCDLKKTHYYELYIHSPAV